MSQIKGFPDFGKPFLVFNIIAGQQFSCAQVGTGMMGRGYTKHSP